MQSNIKAYITNTELQKEFITKVTNNLASIRISNLSKNDFELGYAVLSYLIDKYRLEDRALELIQFYKDQTNTNALLKNFLDIMDNQDILRQQYVQQQNLRIQQAISNNQWKLANDLIIELTNHTDDKELITKLKTLTNTVLFQIQKEKAASFINKENNT